ncbi:MAG: prepilin-type N-terminal cleavage/methylation domain-containing protein [Pseudomonadota bacterium]
MTKRNNTGFTLLELIGVMAVLAILSAALAPAVFQAIDDAYAAAEDSNLERIGDDLIRYIRTTGVVPTRQTATMSTVLAAQSSLPEQKIATNERGFQRLFYFDPLFLSTPDSVWSGYAQTTGLGAAPLSPRLMIISDLGGNVATQPATSAAFNAIWNQSAGAAIVETDRVKIHRLNLSHLFHRILLTNENTSQAGYRLNLAAAQPVAAASGATDGVVSRYVIDGTEVTLFADPYPSGALATSRLVTANQSYLYTTNGTAWFWVTP